MEQWKKIPTFPEYELSTLGRVRNKETKHVMAINDMNGSKFVFMTYKKKSYARSIKKMLKTVFGITSSRCKGGNRHPPKEVIKKGYFNF